MRLCFACILCALLSGCAGHPPKDVPGSPNRHGSAARKAGLGKAADFAR
jgi:hypothetical protein